MTDGVSEAAVTLADLRRANVERHAEWAKGQSLSPTWRGNELAGEVGEACNILKKIERERAGYVGSRATPEQLAEELADVVICADLAAMDFGVDLAAAVQRKFNATSEKNGLASRLQPAADPFQRRDAGWQPIETAPHDRMLMLTAGYEQGGESGWISFGFFGSDIRSQKPAWQHASNTYTIHPEYWREVPDAPTAIRASADLPQEGGV